MPAFGSATPQTSERECFLLLAAIRLGVATTRWRYIQAAHVTECAAAVGDMLGRTYLQEGAERLGLSNLLARAGAVVRRA